MREVHFHLALVLHSSEINYVQKLLQIFFFFFLKYKINMIMIIKMRKNFNNLDFNHF